MTARREVSPGTVQETLLIPLYRRAMENRKSEAALRDAAERLPGALLALDTAGPEIVDAQDEHDALSKVEARMQWACAGPAEITAWCPGTEVLASCTVTRLPSSLSDRLPGAYREMLSNLAARHLPQAEKYRFNLLRLP